MLSDEEKEAIEVIKGLAVYYDDYSLLDKEEIEENEEVNNSINTVINLIEKQSKEIEHQIEKRANQKKELAILNAKQIEFNKLVNTVNSYKGQFKRQQKEIEELKKYKEGYKLLSYSLDNYTSNDKIKAKIEEIDKEEKEVLKGTKGQDRYAIKQEYMHKRSGLQSLLEKE